MSNPEYMATAQSVAYDLAKSELSDRIKNEPDEDKQRDLTKVYDILDKNFITSWDGFIINKVDNGDFRLYYVERGQRDLLLQTDSEEQVCIEFLRVMGRDDKNLLKYIRNV